MKRREFLRAAGAGLAASAIAAPAIAQSMPELKWRLAASWPKSLDTLYGCCEDFSKNVAEDHRRQFPDPDLCHRRDRARLAGSRCGAKGQRRLGHTAGYYYSGKDPSFTSTTALPFGSNPRRQEAWQLRRSGLELLEPLFADFGGYRLPIGKPVRRWAFVPQGSRFRRRSQGLEIPRRRFCRQGGQQARRRAESLAPGDVYPALEKGTIDSVEWINSYDDEKLGLYKVGKYCYYPGWWEDSAHAHLLINREKWNGLSKSYQAVLTRPSRDAGMRMTAKFDCCQSTGNAPTDRKRHAAPHILAGDHGSIVQGRRRDLCRVGSGQSPV